jgi:hypothetical protein
MYIIIKIVTAKSTYKQPESNTQNNKCNLHTRIGDHYRYEYTRHPTKYRS